MRGVVFLGGRKLELREFPDPTPGPGEVVVAMKASGMCGSDLHPYRAVGNAAAALGLGGKGGPVVAGHEPCGVVAARGAGVERGRGADRSASDGPSLQGMRTLQALQGRLGPALPPGHRGLRHDGSRRPRRLHDGAGLHARARCPTSSASRKAPPISCGTGTAYGALKRLDASGRDTLAVFGQGPVGLSATLLGRGDGRARDRDRHGPRAAGARPGVRRRNGHRRGHGSGRGACARSRTARVSSRDGLHRQSGRARGGGAQRDAPGAGSPSSARATRRPSTSART